MKYDDENLKQYLNYHTNLIKVMSSTEQIKHVLSISLTVSRGNYT